MNRRAILGSAVSGLVAATVARPAMAMSFDDRSASARAVVNVSDYPSVQAAINALPPTGGKVVVPTGVWDTPPLTGLPGNVLIEGEGADRGQDWNTSGRGSVIRCNVPGNTFTLGGAANTISLRGLTLEGSGAGSHVALAGGPLAYLIDIDGCHMKGKTNGIKAIGTAFQVFIRDGLIRDTTAEGILIDSGLSTDAMVVIEKTWVRAPGSHGMKIVGNIVNLALRDNAVSDNSAAGAHGMLLGSYIGAAVIENNDIEAFTGAGSYGLVFCGYAATISANSIYACNGGMLVSWSKGIVINPNRGFRAGVGTGSSFITLDSGTTRTIVMPQVTDWPNAVQNAGMGNVVY